MIIALIALGITLWRNRLADLEKDLADPKRRTALLDSGPPRWATAYQSSLNRVTSWADGFYGPNPSWRAFGRCLSLAFLYPIFAAILAWTLANVHSPGGLALFADRPDWPDRAWRTVLLLTGGVITLQYFRNLDSFEEKINHFAGVLFPNSPKFKGTLNGTLGIGAVAVAVAFAIAGAVAGAIAVAVAFAFAVAFAVAGAIAGAVSFAVAGAVTGAGVFALFLFITGETDDAVVLLFFYLALPICNAITDFMSVSATRDFLRWAKRQERPLPVILGILLVDLVIGALCLMALFWGLTKGLDMWTRFLPDTVPMDWRSYWRAAMDDPWQGTALWVMGFTTLLPTIIHVFLGLSAVLTNGSRLRARALAQLHSAGDAPSASVCTRAAKRLTAATLYGWGLAAVMLGGVSWGLWVFIEGNLHWGLVERALAWLFPLSPP